MSVLKKLSSLQERRRLKRQGAVTTSLLTSDRSHGDTVSDLTSCTRLLQLENGRFSVELPVMVLPKGDTRIKQQGYTVEITVREMTSCDVVKKTTRDQGRKSSHAAAVMFRGLIKLPFFVDLSTLNMEFLASREVFQIQALITNALRDKTSDYSPRPARRGLETDLFLPPAAAAAENEAASGGVISRMILHTTRMFYIMGCSVTSLDESDDVSTSSDSISLSSLPECDF